MNSNLLRFALIAAGIITLLAIVIGVPFVWSNMNNVQTEGGYVGYVTQKPIFSSAHYVETQTGPISSGWAWRYNVRNISVTPYSYEEDFPLAKGPMSADQMPVQFHLTVSWKIKADDVKNFVEHFATPLEGDKPGEVERRSYNDYLKDRARSLALSEIASREYTKISTSTGEIEAHVKTKLEAYIAERKAPFDILQVNVTNVAFPPEVANSVAARLAAKQKLEQQDTELQIVQKKAAQRVAEAEGLKKSQEIISATLSKEYLVYLAIEAQKAAVNSPNHTVIYIPSGQMGVPTVGTFDLANPAPSATKTDGK